MSLNFEEDVWMFISLAQKYQVRMLMVGGGAVNFYGYQRHSADVDFWIDTTPSNLLALRNALNELGYEFDDFPEDVKNGQQNISIKGSIYRKPSDKNSTCHHRNQIHSGRYYGHIRTKVNHRIVLPLYKLQSNKRQYRWN